jgi:hypothetical protein
MSTTDNSTAGLDDQQRAWAEDTDGRYSGQVRKFGDVDNVGWCYICTGSLEAADHVVPVGDGWAHRECADAQCAETTDTGRPTP